LAAILFPVFAKAREKARQTSCLSNCKQLGLALMQYMQDNDERGLANWNGAHYWPAIVYPYVKNVQVFNCPSSTRGIANPNAIPEGNFAYLGYALNYLCDNWYYPHGMSEIKKPAETAIFVDGGYYFQWFTGYYRSAIPDSDAYGIDGWATLKGQHNDGNNFTFYDGHAKWVSLSTAHGYTGFNDPFNNWNCN
jgi:prepilin-type processing-associated H-X9-DG protein